MFMLSKRYESTEVDRRIWLHAQYERPPLKLVRTPLNNLLRGF